MLYSGFYLFNVQNIDLFFFEKECECAEGDDTIEGVADAEEESNADERRRPHAHSIKDEGNAVIDRVRYHGFEQHIVRFSEPVEDGIEDVLDGIQDVESEENEHQLEQLIHVGKLQNIRHKGLPERDARAPQYRYDGGDAKVAKRVFANVFFVGCGFLLDELAELQDGQKKPSPNEVICHPIGSLLAHDVDHTGDHHHIRHVANEGFHARNSANLDKFLCPSKIELGFCKYLDALFCKKHERYGEKQSVDDDIGITDSVDAEVCGDGQGGNEEGVGHKAQHEFCTRESVKIFALIDRYQSDEGKLREDGEDVCNALNAYVGCGSVDQTCIGCHQVEKRLCEDHNDGRKDGIDAEGEEHTGSHAV